MKDEISGAIKDRLSSNLMGTFTIFFSTLNWKFITVLFSELAINSKLELASEVFWSNAVYTILLAILLTGVSLFIIPIVKVKYDTFYFKKIAESEYQRKLNEKKVISSLENIDKALSDVIATKNEMIRLQTELRQTGDIAKRINQIGVVNHNFQFVQQEIPIMESILTQMNSDFQRVVSKYVEFQAKFDDYLKLKK